jgi:membrane-bound lytic murein transglycosylase B
MFTCRRILQIGIFTALLAGCSTTQPRPANAVSPASPPPPTLPDASVPRIRIGPAAPSPDEAEGEEPAVMAADGQLRPDVRDYAQQLAAQRGLPLDRLVAILSGARYNATAARLIAPPPGKHVSRSWITYRGRVVEPKRINWGVAFWNDNQDTLDHAAQRFGVPASIIVAIIGVETLYGRNMGSFGVLDTLTTLAFDYPDPAKPDRAAMFRDQLSDFLTLTLQGKLDPNTQGSYAGAIGMAQFMPGSIVRYAVDGDDDGRIDLANSPQDAILSVANFLAQHDWQRGLPVFLPVALPANPAALVDGGLEPDRDWAALQTAGAAARPGLDPAWLRGPLGVIDLPEEAAGTAEYRTATQNFFALTQYNHSYFYATSVADLANAVASTRQRQLNTPVDR